MRDARLHTGKSGNAITPGGGNQMYDDWAANLAVVGATIAAVAFGVLLHYEGLVVVARRLPRIRGPQRIKVLYAILSVIALHVAEIWLFGIAVWLLLKWPACGHVIIDAVIAPVSLLDAVYLSAITFTTVGFGDIVPVGPIRFLSGMEALTGFVLIGWSVSFTYLEMARFWRNP